MNQNTLAKLLKNIIIGGLFIIPFIPLYVANNMFFPYITGKALVMRIVVEIVFALWIVLMFTDKKYTPRPTLLTCTVTGLMVVSLLADLLGVNPLRSIWSNFERMEGWMVIVHLWAYFMVLISVFNTRKLWNLFFNASLISATIVAIYGLFQYFGILSTVQNAVRIEATLGNAAYMAVYMLFHVGLAIYMYFVARNNETGNAKVLIWVYPLLAVLYTFVMFETQTRGTLLGLVGGAMLALAIYSIFGKRESKKSRIIAGSIIGVIILGGILFWTNRDAKFIQDQPTLQRLASISWNDTKTQARGFIWPMAIKGFTEKPILGWGQENFNYIFNANYNPIMYNQEQWFDRAHSVYLDWLVASGILGLIVYLALYVISIIFISKSDLSIAKKSVLIGLIVAYAVHNVFVFDNLISYIMFFMILGFANSFRDAKNVKFLGKESMNKDMVEYVLAPIVIVLLAGSIYMLNIRVIQANTSLISALRSCQTTPDVAVFGKVFDLNMYLANQEAREQLLSCASNVITSPQVAGPTKQAFFELTDNQINNQIKATPNDARIYILAGTFYNNIGAKEKALPVLERAYELSPKKQSIAYQLANAYLMSGSIDKAEALMKETYESETSNYYAKQTYVVVMIMNKKEAQARKEFGTDALLFENSKVADAYVYLKQYDKAIALYKKLASQSPKDINARAAVAQAQYAAGYKWAAVETLKAIQTDFPEYKSQIDAYIQQVQK